MFDRIFKGLSREKRDARLERLETVLNYRFQYPGYLELALIHRSWAAPPESPLRGLNNERLEFLGDSVVNMLVTEFLFQTYPDRREGELSKIKAKAVSGKSLAKCSRKLNLGDFMRISEGERKAGGGEKDSILADVFEAIIGAIYLDGGLEPCRNLVRENVLRHMDRILADADLVNYKSRLLEKAQASHLGVPDYHVEAEEGPEHDKEFVISVSLSGKTLGEGRGSSKKKAEQIAARQALESFEETLVELQSRLNNPNT